MKKILLAATLLVFVLGLAVPAFAVDPEQPKAAQKHWGHKQKGCGELQNVIKESLEKNNKDLAKVKLDVDKFFAAQKEKKEAKLKEIAEKKNISVDELKAQFKAKHQEKAAKRGPVTEEQKQKMIEKHTQRMEQFAKDLGLTTEQLKQIMPEHPKK